MKKFLDKGKKEISEKDILNVFIYGTANPKKNQPVKKWDEYDEIPFDEIIDKELNLDGKNEKFKSGMNLKNFDTKGKNLKMKNIYDISHLSKQNEIIEKNEDKHGVEYELIPDGSGGFLKPDSENKNKLIPIKSPIHPKKIPYQKLDVIYSYDTIQLMESFKLIEYKNINLTKIIDMLAVIRKKRDLKIYDFPEITNAINFIKNNMSSLTPSYLISFVYSLSKMQSLNEEKPSLDNQNLIYESIREISAKIDSIELRGMSNFVYALHSFQMKNPQAYNFGDFFSQLEEKIVSKIAKQRKNITSQDISNIIIAYSKTQNGSEEFFRIIQEIVISMKDVLKTQDIAVVIYSYAKNPNCNEKILEVFEGNIKANINKFLPKELCSILRGYHERNLLNDSLRQKIIETFIEKFEFTNATDLAYFYSILAEEKETKFLKYIRKGILNLSFTFSGLDLAVIFEKAEFIKNNDTEMYNMLQKRVEKLIKDKSINGYELKKIYLKVKDLPFEGKYNIFVEAIEKHLEKLRYF